MTELKQKDFEAMAWESVLARIKGDNWWDMYDGEITPTPDGLAREDIVTGETTILSRSETHRAEAAFARMVKTVEKRLTDLKGGS